MNLWDHDKLYKNLYEQRKRKLRKRVGELGKKKKRRGRESRFEFQFGFMKILLLMENINFV